MLRTQYLALLVGTALVASPAFAQTQSEQPSSGTAGQTAGQSINFLTQQSSNQWRAYKMIGVNVYDPKNEKVGDIKEILLNKEGNAEAVVIGVGGFLGIGEKNVAVPYKSLEFKMEPMRTASTPAPGGTTGTAPGGTTATGGGAGTSGTASSSAHEYPEHAVLSMSKDQLKNAPDFHYASAAASSSGSPSGTTGAPKR